MGLDQSAYVAANADDDYDNRQELAYWRKHPNLQGWMEQLWYKKGRPGLATNCEDAEVYFNGIELELTYDDIVALEKDVRAGTLPATTGFFFGNNADEYYKDNDLKFITEAKFRLFLKQRVFYNSSW